jgi:hypothetical protein
MEKARTAKRVDTAKVPATIPDPKLDRAQGSRLKVRAESSRSRGTIEGGAKTDLEVGTGRGEHQPVGEEPLSAGTAECDVGEPLREHGLLEEVPEVGGPALEPYHVHISRGWLAVA